MCSRPLHPHVNSPSYSTFGLGFRISDFGFRILGFGFQVSSFGLRVSGSGLRFEV